MGDVEVGRELVARACRVLGKLDLTKAASGHVSARLGASTRILIRGRGAGESGVRFTTAREVITVDLDGKKIDGSDELEPPHEVFIHTWMYRARPEIRSVVHVHPATVVLFTICNKPLLPIYGAYDPGSVRLLVDGIPTYPSSLTVSNDELGREFARVMGTKRACLMRGHGLTTCGITVEEAALTALSVSELAEMNYRASLLGRLESIPHGELAAITGQTEGREGARHQDSRWRYYCRLAGE